MHKHCDNIPWLDFETTGLISHAGVVPLEGAVVVTDADLNELGSFGPFAIHASPGEMVMMNGYVTDMHTKTGLIDRVRESTLTREEFDTQLAEFLAPFFPAKGELVDGTKYRGMAIGGNSVKFDFEVIEKFFPKTMANMDYRVIDISSVGELVRRWNTDAWNAMPPKASDHTAMTDIRAGIDELRYYRSVGLTPTS